MVSKKPIKTTYKYINKLGRNTQKFAVLVRKLGHEDEITPIDGLCTGTEQIINFKMNILPLGAAVV